MADKATDVDTYIKDLIGLTDEQFRRVMVLPQGEVQSSCSMIPAAANNC